MIETRIRIVKPPTELKLFWLEKHRFNHAIAQDWRTPATNPLLVL
jgi:hypothetical protein